MSWIIRAMPNLDLFDPLMGPPKRGDKVMVTPWKGDKINISYNEILHAGGPEGKIVQDKVYPEDSEGPARIRVDFSDRYWFVALENLQIVG
jgi:hypothetical protein